jgi:hypothetical protein
LDPQGDSRPIDGREEFNVSAAASAAGYLFAHDQLPLSDLDTQAGATRSHRTPKVESSKRLEQKTVPLPVESESPKQLRTPRIEYRRRRFYPLPTAA